MTTHAVHTPDNPTTTTPPSPALILRGVGEPVTVYGRTFEFWSVRAHAALLALINAPGNAMTALELNAARSGRMASTELCRLTRTYSEWDRLIERPDEPKGVYRLRGVCVYLPAAERLSQLNGFSEADTHALRVLLSPTYGPSSRVGELSAADDLALFGAADAVPEARTDWFMRRASGNESESAKPRRSGYPTLSDEQLRVLFRAMDAIKARIAALRDSLGDACLSEREARRMLEWHARVSAYRNRIVGYYLPIAMAEASWRKLRGFEEGDFIGEACIALVLAVDSYRLDGRWRFATKAFGFVKRRLRKRIAMSRRYARTFGHQLDMTDRKGRVYQVADPSSKSVSHAYYVGELQHLIETNGAGLSEEELAAVRAWIRLQRELKAASRGRVSMKSLGSAIGTGRFIASRLFLAAIRKLRAAMDAVMEMGESARQDGERNHHTATEGR